MHADLPSHSRRLLPLLLAAAALALSQGAPAKALDFRFTDTYIRKDGRWVIVASHASRLATSG